MFFYYNKNIFFGYYKYKHEKKYEIHFKTKSSNHENCNSKSNLPKSINTNIKVFIKN